MKAKGSKKPRANPLIPSTLPVNGSPRMISDLKTVSIEKFKAQRLKCCSVNYVNMHLRTLRSILNKAVKRGYLKSNPANDVDFAQAAEKAKRILEVEEIEALLDACSNVKWRVFCYLAVACGLRLNEITNLLWKDVDLKKGLVRVQNRQDWRTKSKRNRIVGLNDRAIEMFKKIRLQTGFENMSLSPKTAVSGITTYTGTLGQSLEKPALTTARHMI